MKENVTLDITYPQSPTQVWQALTDSAALGEWLMAADFEPLIGFRFRFERKDGVPIKGKVIDVEKEKLLAYTWDDGETAEPSVVCWTLSADGEGTRVQLEHRYVETPEVTCLPIEAHFNWSHLLRYSLVGYLAMRVRPPVFYACDTSIEDAPRERMGFRKELAIR
jgi:uncharacterized protein YndB with AHSA1/START domain